MPTPRPIHHLNTANGDLEIRNPMAGPRWPFGTPEVSRIRGTILLLDEMQGVSVGILKGHHSDLRSVQVVGQADLPHQRDLLLAKSVHRGVDVVYLEEDERPSLALASPCGVGVQEADPIASRPEVRCRVGVVPRLKTQDFSVEVGGSI